MKCDTVEALGGMEIGEVRWAYLRVVGRVGDSYTDVSGLLLVLACIVHHITEVQTE